MKTARLRFDAERHEYHVGKSRLPTVTEIIRGDTEAPRFWTPESRSRGHDLHRLWLEIDLCGFHASDEASVYQGYCRAYIAYLRYAKPKWTELEQPRANVRKEFAGTRDRVGVIGGHVTIADLKSGGADQTHGIQLAGYDLLDSLGGVHRRRTNVYLHRDGTFRVIHQTNDEDYSQFLRKLAEFKERGKQNASTENRIARD